MTTSRPIRRRAALTFRPWQVWFSSTTRSWRREFGTVTTRAMATIRQMAAPTPTELPARTRTRRTPSSVACSFASKSSITASLAPTHSHSRPITSLFCQLTKWRFWSLADSTSGSCKILLKEQKPNEYFSVQFCVFCCLYRTCLFPQLMLNNTHFTVCQ